MEPQDPKANPAPADGTYTLHYGKKGAGNVYVSDAEVDAKGACLSIDASNRLAKNTQPVLSCGAGSEFGIKTNSAGYSEVQESDSDTDTDADTDTDTDTDVDTNTVKLD